MSSQHPMQCVTYFMQTFGQYVPIEPKMPDPQTQNLRYRLIDEECQELRDATDMVEYLDAVGDLLYVVYGAAIAAGLNPHHIDQAFIEIHRSNLSKLWSEDELSNLPGDCSTVNVGDGRYIVRRNDGKVIKSPSYSPANLKKIRQ